MYSNAANFESETLKLQFEIYFTADLHQLYEWKLIAMSDQGHISVVVRHSPNPSHVRISTNSESHKAGVRANYKPGRLEFGPIR